MNKGWHVVNYWVGKEALKLHKFFVFRLNLYIFLFLQKCNYLCSQQVILVGDSAFDMVENVLFTYGPFSFFLFLFMFLRLGSIVLVANKIRFVFLLFLKPT